MGRGFERWPGYDEQSWQQRFDYLDREHTRLMEMAARKLCTPSPDSVTTDMAVREALEFAGDVRWLELAEGAPFTTIDRQLLAEMHRKARSLAVVSALTTEQTAPAQALDREALICTLKAAGGIHNPDENAPFIADAILSAQAERTEREGGK